MSLPKGGKNRKCIADEKLRIINRYLNYEGSLERISYEEKISSGMLSNWIKKYKEKGLECLNSNRGNKFGGFNQKKNPTKLEQLEYENVKLKMEVALLKKD